MKTTAFAFAAIAWWIIIAQSAIAAVCRTKSVAPTNNEIKLIVPFAVPLGVPVAPFAPYFYSYQTTQQIGTLPSRGYTSAAAPDNALPTIPAPRASLIATHCAACHGGQSPKAGVSFDSFDKLSPDNRLKAIRAVVSARMPIGGKLSPDEVRSLVQEFTEMNHGVAEAQR